MSSQIFFLLSDFSHHMLRAHGARRRGRGLQVAGCAGKALAGWDDAGLARGLRASTGACAGRRTLASCCSGPARLLLPPLPLLPLLLQRRSQGSEPVGLPRGSQQQLDRVQQEKNYSRKEKKLSPKTKPRAAASALFSLNQRGPCDMSA